MITGGSSEMVITQDLSKQFDDFLAVDGISLRVSAGEVLALLGPNGAGKTTTVRMLTSVLRPTRGWACLAGYDVVQQPERVRASVGVLTEQHGLYFRMRPLEYLDFFGQLYGLDIAAREARARRLLEEFGLAEYQNRRIGQFSRGMRQKLALARTLLHEPAVLLLDEPTTGMDPASAYLVRDAIQILRSTERTIILCTHNLAEAEKLADQIAIIRRGRIIAYGTPKQLQDSLLGPTEFEVRLSYPQLMRDLKLPLGLKIGTKGPDWFRYRVERPHVENPIVLHSLLSQGLAVISLHEVPRSLEQVYLQAINAPDEEAVYVG